MNPSITQVMVSVVWIRYTIMTAEMLNEIDHCTPHDQNGKIQQKVDEFCTQLEELIAEWNMESTMSDGSKTDALRYMIADHVMSIYATIIGIRRLVRPKENPNLVDAITLRAARKVAQYTLDFSIVSPPLEVAQSICMQYVHQVPLKPS
jgi:hypothetical protein